MSGQIASGLSLMIDDKWITPLMDSLNDWNPELMGLPQLIEDLNFYVEFSPYPLYSC